MQLASVEWSTEVREGPVRASQKAITEIVFASGIKPQILPHTRSVSLQKTYQAADMIVMTVADDECIHLADVNLQQCVYIWPEPKVEEITPICCG